MNLKTAKEKIDKEGKKAVLTEKIAKLKKEAEELNASKAAKLVRQDVDNATAELNGASTLLGEDKVDDAETKISNAETILKSAKEKVSKALATESLQEVEKLLNDIKKKDKKDKYKDKIEVATGLISESKELFNNGSYSDSINKSDEAKKVLSAVTVALNLKKGKYDYISDEEVTRGKENFRTYRVKLNYKSRDCLWRISLKVYKNAKWWPYIYKANREQIKNPDLVFPGQKFKIPPLSLLQKIREKSKLKQQ